MITSLSWLKNHLATKANLNQVAERLTEIGLEVENIKSSNVNLDNFIVCKIVKSQKHPNADKLKLCDVDIGSGNLVKVVCGAQNARDGLFAVYAPPGSVIPKTNMKLKVAKIRGIESQGMLCSGYELDESSDKEGIIELNKKEKNIGDQYFKNTGEKTMDISITPNRPDCLGVRGIARDLASSGLGRLKKQTPIKIKQKFKNSIKISIKSPNPPHLLYPQSTVVSKGSPKLFTCVVVISGIGENASVITEIYPFQVFSPESPKYANATRPESPAASAGKPVPLRLVGGAIIIGLLQVSQLSKEYE